jgi:hypothetical protein
MKQHWESLQNMFALTEDVPYHMSTSPARGVVPSATSRGSITSHSSSCSSSAAPRALLLPLLLLFVRRLPAVFVLPVRAGPRKRTWMVE